MLSFIVVLALFGCSAQILPSIRRIRSAIPHQRIINGMKVSPTDYPYMVSLRADLYYPNGTFDYDFTFCGGTLIQVDPPAVLTAGYCVNLWTETNDTELFGGFGSQVAELYADINRTVPDAEVAGDEYYSLKVTDILMISIHPQYDYSDINSAYDIGIIIFDDGQTVADELTQDMLPTIPAQLGVDDACCVDGETLTILGYGQFGPVHEYDQNYSNKTEHTLEVTTMEYTNLESCLETACPYTTIDWSFPGELWVCVTAPNGTDTGLCGGDGGSPIVRADTNELVGMVSFTLGDDCAPEAGSAGMSVAHHREWIYGILNGDVDPPEICSNATCTTTYDCPPTSAPTMEPSMPTMSPTLEPTIGDETDAAGALWSLGALISGFAVLLKM